MRRLMRLSLLVMLLASLTPFRAGAQTEAPLYVRYCDRSQDGETIETLVGLQNSLDPVVDGLSRYQSGFLTLIEGQPLAEEMYLAWLETPKTDCLSPLNNDITTALSQLLIAMLYWQANNIELRDQYMTNTETLMDSIEDGINESITYLQTVPASTTSTTAGDEPAATATPSNETVGDINSPAPTATLGSDVVRTNDVLQPILEEGLRASGVTLLRNAFVQSFPGQVIVTVQIDLLAGFEFPNTYFTLDALAQVMSDWPERGQLSQVIVETLDGSVVSLRATASGQDFIAHYYENTLSEEEFQGRITMQ